VQGSVARVRDDPARQRRRQAAADQAAALGRRRAAESEQARRLIGEFVREARERDLRPVPLRARAYNGRSTYRTGVEGWYLSRNCRLAVGTGGEFYVLTVPTSLRARWAGVTLTPTDPPLDIGRGARDGESIELTALLRLRLDAGDDWP
jgi:hypothetical protein